MKMPRATLKHATKLDQLLQLRAPRKLLVAIRKAARAQGLSSSAYVRGAIVERLYSDLDAQARSGCPMNKPQGGMHLRRNAPGDGQKPRIRLWTLGDPKEGTTLAKLQRSPHVRERRCLGLEARRT
jgi:hypothetical protein